MTTDIRYLADTSAIVGLTKPEVTEALAPLIADGIVGTCGIVDLDLLSRLRDRADHGEIRADRAAAFPWLGTDDADLRRAYEVQALLADAGHSVPWPALVVAAVAERHGVTVLHADDSFPLIAKITGQPVERVDHRPGRTSGNR